MGLLEPTYDVPGGGDSTFMRFQKGENRFRFLDAPIMGYQYWQDDKVCVRIKAANEAPAGEKPKHFWQVPVWSDGQVKILDITQKTVQRDLQNLDTNSEWGNLLGYDVIVTRSGDGMDTTYTSTPCPKSTLEDEVKTTFDAFKKDYDPKKIFETATSVDAKSDDLPF
tara:strand:- start:116 stop:616 length:501 start_codon:yes stop_codon:yes gene_type:complete